MKKGYINWSIPPSHYNNNYTKQRFYAEKSTPKYKVRIKKTKEETNNLFNQVLRFETLDNKIINGTFNKPRRVR